MLLRFPWELAESLRLPSPRGTPRLVLSPQQCPTPDVTLHLRNTSSHASVAEGPPPGFHPRHPPLQTPLVSSLSAVEPWAVWAFSVPVSYVCAGTLFEKKSPKLFSPRTSRMLRSPHIIPALGKGKAGPEVQGHSQLYIQLKANLGYIRPFI